MPDGSDPGHVERYTDRQVERVRQTVHEPNRSDILKNIRKGQIGNVPSPKPNQRTKPSWSNATVRNNARDLKSDCVEFDYYERDNAEMFVPTIIGTDETQEIKERASSPKQKTAAASMMDRSRR